MAYCKLYINFAAVFNKTMFNKLNNYIMKTLKLTDEQFEDFKSATFYAMHFWHVELETNKDNKTRSVYNKYKDIYELFNK